MSAPLELGAFLPYRLSILTNTISDLLAERYSEQFQLTIPEWRVMAVLGAEGGLTASEVGARTAMDKVSVSRAVSGLRRAGRLSRKVDREDRRRKQLRLTARGRTVYARIVPLAREFERSLLGSLPASDVKALNRLLATLLDAALELEREDDRRQSAA